MSSGVYVYGPNRPGAALPQGVPTQGLPAFVKARS
jgi:hypothetical protein